MRIKVERSGVITDGLRSNGIISNTKVKWNKWLQKNGRKQLERPGEMVIY